MQPFGVALYELSHYAGTVPFCAAISAAASSSACPVRAVLRPTIPAKSGGPRPYVSRAGSRCLILASDKMAGGYVVQTAVTPNVFAVALAGGRGVEPEQLRHRRRQGVPAISAARIVGGHSMSRPRDS
jgi:hypothetical protein